MNPSDKKNLYTPLAETLDDDMIRSRQPPAYQLPESSQQQQQNQMQQSSIPATTTTITQERYIGIAPNFNPVNFSATSPLADAMVVGNIQVGPKPMVVTCPHCRARSKTVVRYSSTAKTHIACILLSWTMVCCCLPYCIHNCQNANHYCAMCDTFIGSYRQ